MKQASLNNLFLTGFMGSGKTTVGRFLARRLNREFADLDGMIEERARCSVADLFRERGEVAFRGFETQTLQRVAGSESHVIALGGGALIREENLSLVLKQGTLIYLEASRETLQQRVSGAAASRPLLAMDFDELFEARRPGYERSSIRVSTEGKSPEQIAGELAGIVAQGWAQGWAGGLA